MQKFTRRYYQNIKDLFADIKAILQQRHRMKALMRGEVIDKRFLERLMLTVTAVNGCRYCSYAHAQMALTRGLQMEEIASLQDGLLEGCPTEEIPALLYAQHWAETQGKPESQTRQHMLETYSRETLDAIELALRTIQMGNRMGNTFDYLLYRISFGRLGNPQASNRD